MSKGLEDIFREGLGDAQSNPSPQTWRHIKNRLWWQDVTHILGSGSVQPSASVWTGISLHLWFSNFLRFSATQFNIYYLVSAASFIAATLVFYPVENERNAITACDRNTIPLIAQISVLNSDHQTLATGSTVFVSLPSVKQSDETPVSTQSENIALTEDVVVVHEELISEKIPLRNFELNFLMPDRSIGTGDSILDWKGNPVTKEQFRWSADLMYAFSDSQSKIKSQNAGDQFLKEPAISLYNMHSAGLGVNYQSGKLSLHSGLAFTTCGFTSDYSRLHYKTDTVVISWVTDGGYYDYDTLWVLNLDSLINGNPTYISVLDSHFIHTSDTLSVNKPVTTKEISSATAITRVSYFEMPLLAGYSLTSGKLSYRVKAGVIPGILFYSKGNMANPYANYGDITANHEIFNKWMLSGYTSFEIHYQPFPHTGFSAEPFYRHSFTGMFNNDFPYNTKISAWGCRFAIRYYIR